MPLFYFNLIFILLTSVPEKELMRNDEQIYNIGEEYFFSYYFINPEGEKLHYQFLAPYFPTGQEENDSSGFNWKLVNFNDTNAVRKYSMTILEGKVNGDQTPILYKYYQNKNVCTQSVTGLIQNSSEIWIHPPRDKGFRILEIDPFIHIKFPLEEGTTWRTELSVGGQWGDKRWETWDGNIEFKTKYTNNGEKKIITKLGELLCFEIEAVSKSSIGQSSSLMYFNTDYGFVKIKYKNIDDSQIIIELEKVVESSTKSENAE